MGNLDGFVDGMRVGFVDNCRDGNSDCVTLGELVGNVEGRLLFVGNAEICLLGSID